MTLLTTTLDNILDSGVVHDNIFNATPTLKWMQTGDRFQIVDGGERLRQGIMYGTNSTAGWYSGHSLLNVAAMEGNTTAFFVWKQGAVSIVYSGLELRSNKGKSKIADLVKTKQTQAELSLLDLIATGVFSDGTGTGGYQVTGLQAMCETTPGTTVYASVPIANTVWVNQSATSVGSAAVNLLSSMRSQYNLASQGKGMQSSATDFIVSTRTIYESYEALQVQAVRYASAKEGDLGFQKLMFKGAIMEWDAYCPSGDMFLLNGNHISLVVERDANLAMSAGGFQKPVNQDSFVAQILFQGNLVTNNRRKQSILSGIT